MKFGSVTLEQHPIILTQGDFGPRHELVLMMFGHLPKYLDYMELGGLGWEKAKDGVVLLRSAQVVIVVQSAANVQLLRNCRWMLLGVQHQHLRRPRAFHHASLIDICTKLSVSHSARVSFIFIVSFRLMLTQQPEAICKSVSQQHFI